MNDSITQTRRIKRITESVISLPTLPTVVSKMLELVDNPKTSAASLARLISTDQTLTARILKLANSAYYGFPREIYTVDTAIVVLGFNTVKDMGLSLTVLDVFKGGAGADSFDVSKLWEHSIGCGIGAKMLARRFRSPLVGEAFVAGLLHDIGKVILNHYLAGEFHEIIGMVRNDGRTLDEAEEVVLGTSHAEIGGWLADKWRLPKIIAESIRYHHAPWEAQTAPLLVAVVAISNYLCHCAGIGNSGRKNPVSPDDRVWDIFSGNNIEISADALEPLETDLLLEYDQAETLLSFIHED
ncbi:MAG: HDOD domain-containing protein [Chitinivibrionales bacterium]|nr:HDOD domain-containing protein [Chitinivibrionales bacterium]